MPKKALKSDDWGIKGSLFVGCIIIGSGVGMIVHDVATWSTIGVGVGFVLIGLLALFGRK